MIYSESPPAWFSDRSLYNTITYSFLLRSKASGGGGMFTMFKNLVGSKTLTKDDLKPALEKMKDHIIGRVLNMRKVMCHIKNRFIKIGSIAFILICYTQTKLFHVNFDWFSPKLNSYNLWQISHEICVRWASTWFLGELFMWISCEVHVNFI